MLSIVIPTLNESKTGYLSKILNAYRGLADIEIICVDGGSSDDTVSLIKQSHAKLITTDVCSRAGRLNEGIKHLLDSCDPKPRNFQKIRRKSSAE